jgi:hypothetical protein
MKRRLILVSRCGEVVMLTITAFLCKRHPSMKGDIVGWRTFFDKSAYAVLVGALIDKSEKEIRHRSGRVIIMKRERQRKCLLWNRLRCLFRENEKSSTFSAQNAHPSGIVV